MPGRRLESFVGRGDGFRSISLRAGSPVANARVEIVALSDIDIKPVAAAI